MSSFQELKELSKAEAGLDFQDIDGNTYVVDKNGNTRYWWQYDSNGNLYYIEPEIGMIRSSTNAGGIYFDEN